MLVRARGGIVGDVDELGLTPTGRKVGFPSGVLVEYVSAEGLKHLAFDHSPQFRDHPMIRRVQGFLPFMENPEVTGLARLAGQGENGFIYPAGTCLTVGEIVRMLANDGAPAGVKAGVELCYVVAEALTEAADVAIQQGVESHGNVSPWSIAIRPDGQPIILAYALPQIEMMAWIENPRLKLEEDSFRYAPPERIEGAIEDLSSDLFSLALVGLELMTGKPVYDGLFKEVKQQATRAEGVRRLYQWRDALPSNLREVFSRALKPDPDTRWGSGLDFVYALHDLLGSIDVDGPSLIEVMGRVSEIQKRASPAKAGETGMHTAEDLAAFVEASSEPLPPPRKPRPEEEVEEEGEDEEPQRWGRVTRPGANPPAAPTKKDDPRARLKQRVRGESGGLESRLSAREQLKERLQRGRKEVEERPRRRRRRSESPSEPLRRPRRTRSEEPATAEVTLELVADGDQAKIQAPKVPPRRPRRRSGAAASLLEELRSEDSIPDEPDTPAPAPVVESDEVEEETVVAERQLPGPSNVLSVAWQGATHNLPFAPGTKAAEGAAMAALAVGAVATDGMGAWKTGFRFCRKGTPLAPGVVLALIEDEVELVPVEDRLVSITLHAPQRMEFMARTGVALGPLIRHMLPDAPRQDRLWLEGDELPWNVLVADVFDATRKEGTKLRLQATRPD